jgi:hypothetical protein
LKKLLIAAALATCCVIAPAHAEFTREGCDTNSDALSFAMCEQEAERHADWLAEHELQREREDACRAGTCEVQPEPSKP